MKRLFKGVFLVLLSLAITSCGEKEEYIPYEVKTSYTESTKETNYVLLEMETGDQMLIELYPDIAPITVTNFKKLIGEKFYDNMKFHRIVKDFVIQAGQHEKLQAENIKGEFDKNDVSNTLKHERGVLSMARTQYDYDSASSQFFIVHKDSPSLNGGYAAFGKVIDGLDTVDRIAEVEVSGETPTNPPVIKYMKFVSLEKEAE